MWNSLNYHLPSILTCLQNSHVSPKYKSWIPVQKYKGVLYRPQWLDFGLRGFTTFSPLQRLHDHVKKKEKVFSVNEDVFPSSGNSWTTKHNYVDNFLLSYVWSCCTKNQSLFCLIRFRGFEGVGGATFSYHNYQSRSKLWFSQLWKIKELNSSFNDVSWSFWNLKVWYWKVFLINTTLYDRKNSFT